MGGTESRMEENMGARDGGSPIGVAEIESDDSLIRWMTPIESDGSLIRWMTPIESDGSPIRWMTSIESDGRSVHWMTRIESESELELELEAEEGEEEEECKAEIESASPPSWVREIEEEAEEAGRSQEKAVEWQNRSIYKLPWGFDRDRRRVDLYEPQVVSLGPYHHGKELLKAIEEHKRRALRHVYRRTKKRVEEFRNALKEGEVLQQLMDAYEDLDPSWKGNKEEFLKMMILDGCFMLEVMRVVTTNDFGGYAPNDPIFSYHGMLSNLSRMKRDMLMLENQIPLLVLHKLFAVEKDLIHELDKEKQWKLHRKVNNMVLDFFQQKKMETPPSLKTRFMSSDDHDVWGLHVLDVVRKSMIKDIRGRRRRSGGVRRGSYDVIWPATQLEEAGIQFRKSDSTSLKDITFQTGCLHATLSLPLLLVDDATESKFLNFVAFEYLHTDSGNEVSSYVRFMNSIIVSDKDVSLLSKNNIIKNFLGTDQAVADLFDGIPRDVSIDPASDLARVHREVTAYCNDPFNKYRASKHLVDFKRSYFKSPWTFISLIAAILLLSLTIIQSVYTILQYYKPN